MILRTELRRSTAPAAGIGFLVVSLGLVYGLNGPWGKGTAPWDEQWTGLAQWTRYLTLFLWPLVLGIGAWQGLRDHRSRVDELFSTTPKPAWRRVLPTAAALALALTASYVVLLVVGGVQVANATSYFHLKWLPVAGVMVPALTGSALLGAGIGRLLPSLVTPPVLAVAALAAQIVAIQSGWLLLTPAFEGVNITVFTTISPTVTATQALWFLGVGVTGFGLLFAIGARARLLSLLPMALVAAVAIPTLTGVDDPTVPDPAAQSLVCDEHGPRVCVTRAHEALLPTLTGPARKALALLRKLPSPPTSVVEMASVEPVKSPPGKVLVYLDTWTPAEPGELMMAVLADASGPRCGSPDWDVQRRMAAARIIAASWLTGELRPLPGYRYEWKDAHDEIERGWRALTALPAAEQPARVEQLREATLDCHDIDLVTP
jgi:hypothetical protein